MEIIYIVGGFVLAVSLYAIFFSCVAVAHFNICRNCICNYRGDKVYITWS